MCVILSSAAVARRWSVLSWSRRQSNVGGGSSGQWGGRVIHEAARTARDDSDHNRDNQDYAH